MHAALAEHGDEAHGSVTTAAGAKGGEKGEFVSNQWAKEAWWQAISPPMRDGHDVAALSGLFVPCAASCLPASRASPPLHSTLLRREGTAGREPNSPWTTPVSVPCSRPHSTPLHSTSRRERV